MSMLEPIPGSQIDPVQAGARTWRRIADFRPGIHTQVAPSRPPGVAQLDGTFGCYAAPTGSLIPLPRLVARITPPPSAIDSDSLLDEVRIGGTFANAPVYSIDPSNRNTIGPEECHTELILATENWDASGLTQRVFRYTRNKVVPAWEEIWSKFTGGTYASTTRPRAAFFGSQRSNSADPDASGPQVVAFVYSGSARFFPPDTATTTTTTDNLPADITSDPQPFVSPTFLVCHQGRGVIFPLYVTGDGADQVYVSSECVYYTPVNNLTVRDPNLSSYFNILGGYEQASGYGAATSYTANELFLVKQRGGALMIYGDLASPSEVRSLPLVQSTGLSLCNGVMTSYGFAYPVDTSGVWIWSGGDSAEHITRHLDVDFWRPDPVGPAYAPRESQTTRDYGHANLQAAQWNELVLWPNWWVWDSDEKGWWQMFDPTHPTVPVPARWVTDDRGIFAWASPSGFTSTSDPAFWEFSRKHGATLMQWKSHPQNHSIDRTVTLDELVVCGQGNGKVRIAVQSDVDRHDPVVIEVEFSDLSRPRPVRVPTPRLSGSSFTFTVTSVGADHDESVGTWDPAATVDAPTVHWVDWAALPGNQLPNG